MIPLFSFLAIIALSMIVIRIGAAALELTGLPREIAAFQAQSAFSGTGFTTSEAESIVNHPVRRKIIQILILLGTAGLTSSVTALLLTFLSESTRSPMFRIAVLVVGWVVIIVLVQSRPFYRFLKYIVGRLMKRAVSLRVLDYEEVLGLERGYIISRFVVKKNNWMVGRSLKELDIKAEGVLVMAIERRRRGRRSAFIGVPTADTVIREGDILICYGPEEVLKEIFSRPPGEMGEQEHHLQVAKTKHIIERQAQEAAALEDHGR